MLPLEDKLMLQSKNTAALCFCWCHYCKVNRAKIMGELCMQSPRALLQRRG